MRDIKQEQKAAQKLKQLSDSLLENAEKDKEGELIDELGTSDLLQYCKRVKYLEKAWILVQRNGEYYWVDQERIPIERLKKIKVQEIEEKQDTLQKKMEELQRDKETLVRLVQKQSFQKTINESQIQHQEEYL